MNNSDRSHKARVAFNASGYDDGDAMTNLYDLVCDLLHLADEYRPTRVRVSHRTRRPTAVVGRSASGTTAGGDRRSVELAAFSVLRSH